MTCTGEGMTDPGLKREENEDAFLVDTDLKLFAVADGMGGMERGAFASQFALEAIHRLLSEKPLPTGDISDRLKRAVRATSDLLRRVGGTYTGTTLVLALIRDGTAYIASLGDSRAYLFRKGELRRLTADDNLAAQLLAMGKISAEEARHSPERKVITAYVGMEGANPKMGTLEVESGDWILLCSDGLWSQVDDSEIARILKDIADTRSALRELIGRANAAGGEDNVAAVLVNCVV